MNLFFAESGNYFFRAAVLGYKFALCINLIETILFTGNQSCEKIRQGITEVLFFIMCSDII